MRRTFGLTLAFALAGCQAPARTPVPPAASQPADDDQVSFRSQADEAPEERIRQRPKHGPVTTAKAAEHASFHGNPEGAALFYERELARDASVLETRLALAHALQKIGEYERAQSVLEGSNDRACVLMRARLERLRGRNAAAEATLRGLLKANTDDLEVRGELVALWASQGRASEPEAMAMIDALYDAYEAGRVREPESALAVARAALARGSTAAFKDANDVLQEAEEAAQATGRLRTLDRILLLRGAVFSEKYAGQEAEATYAILLERDPWDPDALVGMAGIYVDALQFAPASRFAEEALMVNPHHPDAHAALARIALIEGRRDEAEQRARDHVLVVDATHPRGLAVLAALAIMRAQPAQYDAWRDKALRDNPRNGRFFRELADLLAFLHLYRQAQTVLDEGIARVPDDPYVQSALGLNLLRLGDEPRGRESLQRAWKRDRFNERTRNVLDLYTEHIDPEYTTFVDPRATLRLPKADAELVRAELDPMIERALTVLEGHYGRLPRPLRLEFYANTVEFSVRTVGVPSLGAVAVCFGDVTTFVGPYNGSHNIAQVIWHELGHVFAIEYSGGRVPRWFTEGLSEWESELADPAWARDSADLLWKAQRRGKIRELWELELAFIRAESPEMMEVAYATSTYAVRYLGQTYGRAKLIEMLRAYGNGLETEAVARDVLGTSLPQLSSAFTQWLEREIGKRRSGWEPGTSRQHEDPRDTLFARAVAAARRKDIPGAERLLHELIDKRGDGYSTRMLLANLLLEGNEPSSARPHLERAMTFDVESVPPLVMLAELARREQQPAEEKRVLQRALDVDANALDPAARLLALGVVTADLESIAAGLSRARAIAPLHPLVLCARAILEQKNGQADEAQQLLSRGLRDLVDGHGPSETYVVAALAAHALGRHDDARRLAALARKDTSLRAPERNALAKIR